MYQTINEWVTILIFFGEHLGSYFLKIRNKVGLCSLITFSTEAT